MFNFIYYLFTVKVRVICTDIDAFVPIVYGERHKTCLLKWKLRGTGTWDNFSYVLVLAFLLSRCLPIEPPSSE